MFSRSVNAFIQSLAFGLSSVRSHETPEINFFPAALPEVSSASAEQPQISTGSMWQFVPPFAIMGGRQKV